MKTVMMSALAGLVSAASAQGVTLHFDLDGDPLTGRTIAPSASDRWTVYASFTGFDDPTAYFGNFVGEFNGNGPGTATDLVNLLDGQGTAAQANGTDITNINIFQSVLLGSADSSNPIAIFSFATIGVTDTLEYVPDGVASVFADDGMFTFPTEFTEIAVISDRIWVPAPGSGAAIGICAALFFGGRRRSA